MRTYFHSEDIACIWVGQAYKTGRCPSNMSFHGASFYSYGMEIGRVIVRKGKKAYLLTVDGYSDTTSRHKGICQAAIPDGSTIFWVSRLDQIDPVKSKRDAKRMVANALFWAARDGQAASRARERKLDRLCEQRGWIRQAELITAYFELPPQDFDSMKAEVTGQIKAEKKRRELIAIEEAAEKERDQLITSVMTAFTNPIHAN